MKYDMKHESSMENRYPCCFHAPAGEATPKRNTGFLKKMPRSLRRRDTDS